jgi:hypothetical protein
MAGHRTLEAALQYDVTPRPIRGRRATSCLTTGAPHRALWLASCATASTLACDLTPSTPTVTTQIEKPIVNVAAMSQGTVGDSNQTLVALEAGVPTSSHCVNVYDYNNCYFYIIAAFGPSGAVPPPTIMNGGADTLYWDFTAPGWSIQMGAFWASDTSEAAAQLGGSVKQMTHGSVDTVQVLWWVWPDSAVGQRADSEHLVPLVKPLFEAAAPIDLVCAVGSGVGTCNPLVAEAQRVADRGPVDRPPRGMAPPRGGARLPVEQAQRPRRSPLE